MGVPLTASILNLQDPNVVVPVAVTPPAVMANAGVAEVLVKASVVGVVVPKAGTPVVKVNGLFTIAAEVLAVTAAAVLLVEVVVVTGVESPPPQAAKAADTRTVKNNLLALFMKGLYWGYGGLRKIC